MITPEAFYKQTNDNFATVFGKLDDITKEQSSQRESLNTHLAVGKALDKKKSDDKKRNWFITGITISVGFGLWKVIELLLFI